MSQKTKKFYFLLLPKISLCLIVFMFISSCKNENNIYEDTLRIGVALYSQEDTFISSIAQSFEKMAQAEEVNKKNIKINLTIVDAKSNQTTQMEQIDRFINRKYDILCVNIVDRTAASVIIDKAKDAKTPIIFFNREPVAEDMLRWENVFYVGSRSEQGGILQGELVLQAWQTDKAFYDKNCDDTIQYIMLEGEPAHQDTLLRSEYCVKALKDHGIAMQKLSSDTANWSRTQAQTLTSEWIKEFGDKIEVVFANNDDMALGAIDAFKSAGFKVPLVVGVDAVEPAIKAIEEGDLYGTVKNDGEGIAQNMLKLILNIYDNKSISNQINLENNHYIWLDYKK